ncbi:MAG: PAS domain S-box protein, partial [Methanosarcinaceae archaeon]|nr:PAS domain S-box protein [Methanosarcinaceae archaeon]
RVILTNPKMAHILGQDTPEQAVSYLRNIQEQIFVDPKSNEKIKTLLEKQGYVENFECEILRADARSIWVLINAKVSNELKAGAFIVDGFVHDITERKRAEEMLKQTEMKYR